MKPEQLPFLPPEIEHVWNRYIAISNRRQNGMERNAISIEAVAAYYRRRLIDLSVWEFDLVCALDDAVMGVWANAKPPRAADEPVDVPVDNPKGIGALLRNIAARKTRKPEKGAE